MKIRSWLKVNENEWKPEDKDEIAEGWNTTRYRNTYDPLGEVFFFAAGPFFKPPAFFAPAFAFGRGLLRERSSSFLSPTCAFTLPFTLEWWMFGKFQMKITTFGKLFRVFNKKLSFENGSPENGAKELID